MSVLDPSGCDASQGQAIILVSLSCYLRSSLHLRPRTVSWHKLAVNASCNLIGWNYFTSGSLVCYRDVCLETVVLSYRVGRLRKNDWNWRDLRRITFFKDVWRFVWASLSKPEIDKQNCIFLLCLRNLITKSGCVFAISLLQIFTVFFKDFSRIMPKMCALITFTFFFTDFSFLKSSWKPPDYKKDYKLGEMDIWLF